MAGMDSTFLGHKGESLFHGWCLDAGLNPNKADIDLYGWDFAVEFPSATPSSASELHDTPPELKVQVKATDGQRGRFNIGLKNAYRLAVSPLPCFVVILEFDGGKYPDNAYLVHFDKDLIFRALKRVHKVSQEDDFSDINKKDFYVSYGENQKLEKEDGESFKNKVVEYIGGKFSSYVNEKKEILEGSGYEEGVAKITFSVSGETQLKALIDSSLGIATNVDVEKCLGVDTRFGIESKFPFLDSKQGQIEIRPQSPTYHGKMRFRKNYTYPWISYGVNIYTSVLNNHVPDYMQKVRIDGDFFEIILYTKAPKADFSLKIDIEKRFKIDQLLQAYRLFDLLANSEGEVFCELIPDGLDAISFMVSDPGEIKSLDQELYMIETAKNVAIGFDIFDFLDLSISELYRDASKLKLMSIVFSDGDEDLSMRFDGADVEGFFRELESDKGEVYLNYLFARLGPYRLIALASFSGAFEASDEGVLIFDVDKVSCEERFILEEEDLIPGRELVSALEKTEEKYSDGLNVIHGTTKKHLIELDGREEM